jgi:hypothetical protein
MSTDALGAITSHEANNESTNNRNKHFKETEFIASRRNKSGTPALKEKKVGEKSNQPEQKQRNERADEANTKCKEREKDHTRIRGKITKLT